ncbi:MAG: metal ABC transporter permease [Phycisphaerales bacterium]
MKTLRYLSDPAMFEMFAPAILAGLAVAIACAVLSPLAVLKRMSFVGQGISHAALGGVGVVAIVSALGGTAAAMVSHEMAQSLVIFAFCAGSAWLIARLTERGSTAADTAIGIVLVGAMTLGAILVQLARRAGASNVRSWESLLFGDMLVVTWTDAGMACVVAAAVLGAAWWFRRPMVFWAFDEAAAPAFGVSSWAMKHLLVGLLALAIVASMKLAGVLLATAMLVLPGAIALRLSRRLWVVMGCSLAAGLLGVVGGLVASFEMDLPPGGAIVGVLVLGYAAARAWPRREGASEARGVRRGGAAAE